MVGAQQLWRCRSTTSCPGPGLRVALRETALANLEVADETAEGVLGHSPGGLIETYNVSLHRKQKMAALVALEAELRRIAGE
jgi:hypothetical protein